MMTKKQLNDLAYSVLGSAIEVHKELGPGLLESIYEKCLIHVLKQKGIRISSQQKIPLIFRGIQLDCDLRYDILVENEIIVEIKAVDNILPVHQAQLLTYLKLLNKSKGLLINFNCTNIFKEGQKAMVTPKFAALSEE
ncbi:MAG: GxxExxY protein [Bacteroidales bacterium]